MTYIELGYIGLFLACFISATILPFTSEGVLILFLISGFDPLFCFAIATIGNTLGGITNYLLGMLGNANNIENRFKNPDKFKRASLQISKYGYWLGLISWVPIIGDPLTILLGFFRVKFIPFLVLMTFGKMVRYALIIFIWQQ